MRAALKDPALGLVREMLDDDQNLESIGVGAQVGEEAALPHAEKWLLYKAQLRYGPHTSMFEVAMGPIIDGTLDHMADFLFMFYKTMASLGIHVPMWVESDDDKPSSAQSRAPVLMVKAVVAETTNDEPVAVDSRKQRWQKLMEKKRLVAKPAESNAVAVSNAVPATCRFKCGHPPPEFGPSLK